MTVTPIKLTQRRWIAFAGIVVEFTGPEDSEAALADRARKAALEMFRSGTPVEEWDIGVTDIQLHPADDI